GLPARGPRCRRSDRGLSAARPGVYRARRSRDRQHATGLSRQEACGVRRRLHGHRPDQSGEGQAFRGPRHTVNANMTELHRLSGTALADPGVDPKDSELAFVRLVTLGPAVLAAGMLALGIQSLFLRDFISGWQPVPQTWPARNALAIDSALLIIVCSVG